jgi:hypothetical protein
MPFDGLQDQEVERNYAEEKLPGVEALVLGDIIRHCWDEQVDSVTDVLKYVISKMVAQMKNWNKFKLLSGNSFAQKSP